jgi:hypothetical protein
MPKSPLPQNTAVPKEAPMDIERINAIGAALVDLSERTEALRGYL